MYHTCSSGRNHSLESGVGGYFNADRRAARKAPEEEVAGDCCQVVQILRVVQPLVCHLSSVRGFMKLSPSKSHIFRIVFQELCPCDGTSQRTAAVPAKAPGAARLSFFDRDDQSRHSARVPTCLQGYLARKKRHPALPKRRLQEIAVRSFRFFGSCSPLSPT